jgi:hypothetical protein
MKKTLCILLPILAVCAILFFVFFAKSNQSIVYATDIVSNVSTIELEVGDTLKIDNDSISVSPLNCTEKLVFTTNDSSVATCGTLSGIVSAQGVGSCNLIVSVSKSQTENIKTIISIVVTEKVLYAEDVEIDDTNLVLAVGESKKLNIKITGSYNALPSIESENGLLTCNPETFVVSALKTGSDVLNISFPISKTQTKEFKIAVMINPKNEYSQNIEIKLDSENYAMVEYSALSDEDDCQIAFEYGEDVVEIAEQEYKHLILVAKKLGTAKIVIQTPAAISVIYVTVV